MHATMELLFNDIQSNTYYPLPWLLCKGADVFQMTWCQMLHFGTWSERIAKHMCFKLCNMFILWLWWGTNLLQMTYLVYNWHILWQHVFTMYIGEFLHPFVPCMFLRKNKQVHMFCQIKLKIEFFFLHFACFVVA